MNRRGRIIPLFCVLLLLGSCTNSAEDISFTGTWNMVKENGISGETTTSIVNVSVGKNRFRISSRDQETETIEAYDGRVLHRKSVSLQLMDAAPAPTITVDTKSDIEVASRRFWKRSFAGAGMAGGQIAGRETLLYQTQEKTFDGEMTMQAWVDADTKVILKKIFTIYSSQIEQMVSRTKEECVEIKFGPVDETTFSRL